VGQVLLQVHVVKEAGTAASCLRLTNRTAFCADITDAMQFLQALCTIPASCLHCLNG
jgi:hypothetical protein